MRKKMFTINQKIIKLQNNLIKLLHKLKKIEKIR